MQRYAEPHSLLVLRRRHTTPPSIAAEWLAGWLSVNPEELHSDHVVVTSQLVGGAGKGAEILLMAHKNRWTLFA